MIIVVVCFIVSGQFIRMYMIRTLNFISTNSNRAKIYVASYVCMYI